MNRIFIDFEGIDGVGKGLQSRILFDRLKKEGHDAGYMAFPEYSSFFGKMIGKYLNGGYGSLETVPAEFPTLLYALDRWKYFTDNKNLNKIIIADRYVISNIAHQTAKMPEDERESFMNWIMHLEYEIFKIPKPNIIVILDADPNITSKYVLKKQARAYTDKKMDIHEKDDNYLRQVRAVFQKLSRNENHYLIKCDKGTSLRSVNEISDEIWNIIIKKVHETL